MNDEGNIAVKTPCFVEFLLSFDDQGEDFSIVYGIKNEFSNNVANCIRAIADDVMTDNIYKTTDLTYRVTF